MAAAFRLPSPGFGNQCNKVRKEGRKQTGLAREDSGEFYLQINLNRSHSARPKNINSLGCLSDHSQHSLRLSLSHRPCARVLTPSLSMSSCFTVAFIWSPRQLLQSDTGVPHFALDPLTYRCLLSLSPAADFAEPRPPRHTGAFTFHFETLPHRLVCLTSLFLSVISLHVIN